MKRKIKIGFVKDMFVGIFKSKLKEKSKTLCLNFIAPLHQSALNYMCNRFSVTYVYQTLYTYFIKTKKKKRIYIRNTKQSIYVFLTQFKLNWIKGMQLFLVKSEQ